MTNFQVTLNFSFRPHDIDHEEEYESSRISKKKQTDAYARTQTYYETHSVIDYIKSHDAMEMVEYVLCDGEVLSARWDPTAFAVHMVISSKKSEEDLREELEMNSLEDGEYEGCGDSGWILFTRGPQGEVYEGGDSPDAWEYGLVDYRQNPIEIQTVA